MKTHTRYAIATTLLLGGVGIIAVEFMIEKYRATQGIRPPYMMLDNKLTPQGKIYLVGFGIAFIGGSLIIGTHDKSNKGR